MHISITSGYLSAHQKNFSNLWILAITLTFLYLICPRAKYALRFISLLFFFQNQNCQIIYVSPMLFSFTSNLFCVCITRESCDSVVLNWLVFFSFLIYKVYEQGQFNQQMLCITCWTFRLIFYVVDWAKKDHIFNADDLINEILADS